LAYASQTPGATLNSNFANNSNYNGTAAAQAAFGGGPKGQGSPYYSALLGLQSQIASAKGGNDEGQQSALAATLKTLAPYGVTAQNVNQLVQQARALPEYTGAGSGIMGGGKFGQLGGRSGAFASRVQ
jgi:hypothetical protein